jgi:phosphoglycolate phosphatase
VKIRSVTLDLDGTLVDTVADLAEAANRMLAELGEPSRTVDEVRSFVGKGIPKLVERCLDRGELPSFDRLHAAHEVFKRHYAEVNGVASTIYPGVMEGLEYLKARGVPMGVITNKANVFTDQLLERLGLTSYFAVVVGGDTTPNKKPHPDPVLYACDALGSRPEENLHIGDSMNDIEAARAAGSPVYCVPYGYNEGEEVDSDDCDALVSTVLEAAQRVAA